MGRIGGFEPVKLFAGMLASSEDLFAEAEICLSAAYGPVDTASETIPFTFTDYYTEEMGKGLLRKWVGFKDLIDGSSLAEIKLFSDGIEKKYSAAWEKEQGKTARRVNIDPGYLCLSRVILASTKDFSHRIYLARGIFAEVTLMYQNRGFAFLPWTYSDYKSETALRFLTKLRETYSLQLKGR